MHLYSLAFNSYMKDVTHLNETPIMLKLRWQ